MGLLPLKPAELLPFHIGADTLPPETRELISQSLQGRSFVAAESLQLAEAWNFGGLMDRKSVV